MLLRKGYKNMSTIFDESKNLFDKLVPISENLVKWFSLPKEDARQYLIEAIKNTDSLSSQETVALIYNSRKLVKEYANCRTIFEDARQKFEKNADINKIDVDWIDIFFDKAKLVNKKDMQIIWSCILAQEVNTPGSINPSLLHALSIMTYNQAKFFCNIARFCFKSYKKDTINPLIFYSTNVVAYNDSGIYDKNLRELHRLGLIEYNPDSEFIFHNKVVFVKGTKLITIYGDPKNDNKIKAGNVIFTNDGQALYSIVDEEYKKYRHQILDFTVEKFIHRGCTVTINGININ